MLRLAYVGRGTHLSLMRASLCMGAGIAVCGLSYAVGIGIQLSVSFSSVGDVGQIWPACMGFKAIALLAAIVCFSRPNREALLSSPRYRADRHL